MQPQNKPPRRRKYIRIGGPATFKTDVLKRIANGQSVAYVAQALGINDDLLPKNWLIRTLCGNIYATRGKYG
ncbi:hypothetical protein GCM10028825_54790 [Spirosoma agri]